MLRWIGVGALVLIGAACAAGGTLLWAHKAMHQYASCIRHADSEHTDPSACVMPPDRAVGVAGRDAIDEVAPIRARAQMVWAGRALLDEVERDRAADGVTGVGAGQRLRLAGAWRALSRRAITAGGEVDADLAMEAGAMLGDVAQLERAANAPFRRPNARIAALACLSRRPDRQRQLIAAERIAIHESGSIDLGPWSALRASCGMEPVHEDAIAGYQGDLMTVETAYGRALARALRDRPDMDGESELGGLGRLRIAARALRGATQRPAALESWLTSDPDAQDDLEPAGPDWALACGAAYTVAGPDRWTEDLDRIPVFTQDLEAAAALLDGWAARANARDAALLRSSAGEMWLQAGIDRVARFEHAAARRALAHARELLPRERRACMVTPLVWAEDFENAEALARALVMESREMAPLERALRLDALAFVLGEQGRSGEGLRVAMEARSAMGAIGPGATRDAELARIGNAWLVGALAVQAGRDVPPGVTEAGYGEMLTLARRPERARRALRARASLSVAPGFAPFALAMWGAGAPRHADAEPFLDAAGPTGSPLDHQRHRLVAARWRDDRDAQRLWRRRAVALRALARSDADEVLLWVALDHRPGT